MLKKHAEFGTAIRKLYCSDVLVERLVVVVQARFFALFSSFQCFLMLHTSRIYQMKLRPRQELKMAAVSRSSSSLKPSSKKVDVEVLIFVKTVILETVLRRDSHRNSFQELQMRTRPRLVKTHAVGGSREQKDTSARGMSPS